MSKVHARAEIIKPHKKISREVTEKDLARVFSDSRLMLHTVMQYASDVTDKHFALAHCQITKWKPLRFFSLNPNLKKIEVDGEDEHLFLIINPKIVDQSDIYPHSEGCLSYPNKRPIYVPRFKKVTVEFQTLRMVKDDNEDKSNLKLSKKFKKGFDKTLACIFQHEIDHFEAKTIFDEK